MDMPTQGNAPAPAIFKKLSYQSHDTPRGGALQAKKIYVG